METDFHAKNLVSLSRHIAGRFRTGSNILSHVRDSTVGFLLFQCSSDVVQFPGVGRNTCGSLLLLVLAVRIYTLVHLLCE